MGLTSAWALLLTATACGGDGQIQFGGAGGSATGGNASGGQNTGGQNTGGQVTGGAGGQVTGGAGGQVTGGAGGQVNGGAGGQNNGGQNNGGSGGGMTACAPGAIESCYSGPAGTEGVGPCKAGSRTCLPDGSAFGPCMGEVLPGTESCQNLIDDDCDGLLNESGAGCVCVPNGTSSCYTGPAGTLGVGICAAGITTCNAQGTAWGPCMGEVLPQVENCNTATDDDCNGQAPPCQGVVPIIDLRADNNRNGTIDLADPTEDAGEDQWAADHGAIFLANLDDDQSACPTSNQTDAQLAACNDAADTVVNGASDLDDMARLQTVPWPTAPANASATVTVNAGALNYVRLFKKTGNTFSVFNSGSSLTAAELQAGVELAIEGRDIVRNPNTWDGFVTVTLNVEAGSVNGTNLPDGSDSVELRVAPALFRHHLDETERVYVTQINSNASSVFRADLATAVTASGVPQPTTNIITNDQWTQDFFETAYMSMPAPGGGQKVIHINFRSANYTNGTLRSAGRVVFTGLRGPDVAGAVAYDPNHSNGMDTLNSFGNLETIPPFTHNGVSWPNGRVIRGSVPSFYPDTVFDAMVQAQGEQDIVYVDTAWLLVAHIDETTSFIKAQSPRGWVMLAADPALAVSFFEQLEQAGYGSSSIFVGKTWSGGVNAQVTIDQVLNDADVMNESAWAATEIDGQLTTIKAATGLTDSEIVTLPFLFQQASGYSVAYQPGTVNGIYLSDGDFGAPDIHGPTINGSDPFQDDMEAVLAPYGVTVHWIEDWDLYHRLDGEVHCGTNVTRAIPATPWWESQ